MPFAPLRFPDGVPVLTDGRVTLRAHRLDDVAATVGMGNRINTIMQTCFFAISGVFAVNAIVTILTFAAAEEVAWRGYLLPRLLQLGRNRALAITGLVHAAWHLPLVLLTGLTGACASSPPMYARASFTCASKLSGSICKIFASSAAPKDRSPGSWELSMARAGRIVSPVTGSTEISRLSRNASVAVAVAS